MTTPLVNQKEPIMSNKVKLYTEEQVREAYLEGWNDGQHDNIGHIDRVVFSLTPIELPSDEEIENLVEIDRHDFYKCGFEEGAKWVIDKLKNQQ